MHSDSPLITPAAAVRALVLLASEWGIPADRIADAIGMPLPQLRNEYGAELAKNTAARARSPAAISRAIETLYVLAMGKPARVEDGVMVERAIMPNERMLTYYLDRVGGLADKGTGLGSVGSATPSTRLESIVVDDPDQVAAFLATRQQQLAAQGARIIEHDAEAEY